MNAVGWGAIQEWREQYVHKLSGSKCSVADGFSGKFNGNRWEVIPKTKEMTKLKW